MGCRGVRDAAQGKARQGKATQQRNTAGARSLGRVDWTERRSLSHPHALAHGAACNKIPVPTQYFLAVLLPTAICAGGEVAISTQPHHGQGSAHAHLVAPAAAAAAAGDAGRGLFIAGAMTSPPTAHH